MAPLTIKWQSAETITKPAVAVVTGEDAEEGTTAESGDETGTQLKWTDKPILVFVCDEAETCEDIDKVNDIVLVDEKIALGMRAFRTLKMDPECVEADAFLEGHGKTVPRMLLIDPVSEKITVLEMKKLKSGTLFKAMKKTAGKFWEEKLDKVVKSHLKLLTEQDQLANADKTLAAKQDRISEDEKKLAEVKAERAEIQEELQAISKAQSDLWNLTPKHKSS